MQIFSRQGNEEAGRKGIRLRRVIQDLQGVESYRRELAVQSLDHGDERIWRDSIQFMTVSDGHDQMFVQLREFKLTQNLYGLPLPTHFSTDNVPNDRPFFLEMFPRARAKQTQYDNNQVSVSSANDAS